MSEHVRVQKQGPVLSVTLARPERRNAITVAMYAALADAVEQAAADPSIRVVTFRGEGVDFAAGNDLADFLAAPVAKLRSWPRCTAIAWASERRCSSTATW
jgi:enoyl-CoA hydratase/carnithine racemase